MGQAPPEGGRLVGDAELGLLAVGTLRGLRHEQLGVARLLGAVGLGVVFAMVLREVRLGALDLHEAFAADGLVAAPGVVEEGRVVEEADGALGGVLVEGDLERLAIDAGVLR